MTVEEMDLLFKKYGDDEYREFESIESPLHPRPDMCAFLLLHNLCGGTHDMISTAEYDEIWLDVEPEDFAKAATEADIITLVRCGVRYDGSSFCMFV